MSQQETTIPSRVVIQVLVFIVLIPFLPLLISWQWSWWEAWVYTIVTILGFAGSRALAGRRHPDLIAERAHYMQQENIKRWDKQISAWLGLGGVVVLVVAGLDARFAWSAAFGALVKIVALVAIIAGYALGSYALIENRYFSGTVRIQADRDHQVVSSGPYGWVRHPGYAGALLTYVATPFFLDSSWALLPTALAMALMVVRTAKEDRVLQDELPGYREYAGRVHYRLLPRVW